LAEIVGSSRARAREREKRGRLSGGSVRIVPSGRRPGCQAFQTIKELHDHYETEISNRWNDTQDAAKWQEEHRQYAETNPGLADTGPNPGFLDAHARKDSDFQMETTEHGTLP